MTLANTIKRYDRDKCTIEERKEGLDHYFRCFKWTTMEVEDFETLIEAELWGMNQPSDT